MRRKNKQTWRPQILVDFVPAHGVFSPASVGYLEEGGRPEKASINSAAWREGVAGLPVRKAQMVRVRHI